MNKNMNKRGISPVIATVMLVVIAIILFLLVYLWITSFQKEAVLKFNSPIETACLRISFNAMITGANPNKNIQITNMADLPIHRFELYNVNSSGTTKITTPGEEILDISPAGSTTFSGISCSKIKVVPYLLGKTKAGKEKEYACEKQAKTFNC